MATMLANNKRELEYEPAEDIQIHWYMVRQEE